MDSSEQAAATGGKGVGSGASFWLSAFSYQLSVVSGQWVPRAGLGFGLGDSCVLLLGGDAGLSDLIQPERKRLCVEIEGFLRKLG